MRRCEAIFDVANRREKITALEEKSVAPDFWNDQNAAKAVIDETNTLKAFVEPFDKLVADLEEMELFIEMGEGEDDEATKVEVFAEATTLIESMRKQVEDVEMKSLLGGKFDGNSAYLSINAGAGGTESCDWAEMLARMYRRYCERQGFEFSVMSVQPGEEAGIKSISAHVSGPFAYGLLKAERGVHRLVRISPFDSASRRHTSFVALDLIAEIDDSIDVKIEDKDLRVDTYRASGAGGQHVNTTDSAVRLTHMPTGIVVTCQAERSQHANRDRAMKILTASIYEYEMDKKRKESEKFYGDKGAIAWGSQIRSYVMQPYTMVKDHRTNTESGNVMAVMDGDINQFIQSYLKHSRTNEPSEGNS